MDITPEEVENFQSVKILMRTYSSGFKIPLDEPKFKEARRHLIFFLLHMMSAEGKSDKEIFETLSDIGAGLKKNRRDWQDAVSDSKMHADIAINRAAKRIKRRERRR